MSLRIIQWSKDSTHDGSGGVENIEVKELMKPPRTLPVSAHRCNRISAPLISIYMSVRTWPKKFVTRRTDLHVRGVNILSLEEPKIKTVQFRDENITCCL